MRPNVPIDVISLLPALDRQLIELLKSLSPEEWQAQTIARLWKVKDVAAHLLDGNIRTLSMARDGYFHSSPEIHSYEDLIGYLNGLNAEWVAAMKRASPQVLILLHELTGPLFCEYYASLDPFGKAIFPVDWAGESESRNWMHIARDYTEKFLHQQQIRDAVHKPGIMTREFFYPFIDVFMLALPHTFREVHAPEGTSVMVTVTGESGGSWALQRSENRWQLTKSQIIHPTAEVRLSPDTSWRLFSKSLRPEQVRNDVVVSGDQKLGEIALTMVSVMA